MLGKSEYGFESTSSDILRRCGRYDKSGRALRMLNPSQPASPLQETGHLRKSVIT